MESDLIDSAILERATSWLNPPFDKETSARVRQLIDSNPQELMESFYADLEFGTGGLRGIMGDGPNRINKYTIGLATQGLADYLNKQFPDEEIRMAIAHDSRNKSDYFAKISADILSANGIHVYLFSALRPTPELSFAVRFKQCKSGIVITASHNPSEYNGYKVYWEDGGQIVAPHDKNIIEQVRSTEISQVKFEGNEERIHWVDKEIDDAYLEKVKSFKLSPSAVEKNKDLKIVYTALHGTGITMVPEALKNHGFQHVILVPKQDVPDGNFPTVTSPNPEEAQALQAGLDLCRELDADILLGTDPDADRVGIAVKDHRGEFQLLNGNQAGSLLVYYHLLKWKELGKLNGKQFVTKTIVTTDLIEKMADDFNVKIYNTLTGFKFIAAKILELEGKEEFIAGGEESYGYLVGDFVRDKDAVISAVMFCEIVAWAKAQGKTLMDVLLDIYEKYGYFRESLVSITKKGKSGKEEIAAMMQNLKNNPPFLLGGSKVVQLVDCENQVIRNLDDGTEKNTGLPQSNVIQFLTEDKTRVTARPSGTEPKIKFYFSVNQPLNGKSVEEMEVLLNRKIQSLKVDLNVE